ncbi:MAG: DNA repair protein RecN [Bdellovibrionales bacterium RBG_16_40_8]|nr:MAG: DNA repair protein RecN [Bdellovibrionales bacterium RBG_16_40_8]
MLNELKVANFAIIDKISVQFKSGLNVLSGETGSGKSVLLKSLSLLMGEKSISDTVKTGAEQATVEGSFDISKRPDIKERLIKSGISTEEASDPLIVKRIISLDGKNRVYINGSLSTLHQLRDIVAPLIELTGHPAPLIEMTGQHDNRHLQSPAFHLEALDQYIGGLNLRLKIEELFTEKTKLSQELLGLEENSREKTKHLDFLTYQQNEIKAASLKIGDENAIENEIYLLKNSSRLAELIDNAESILYTDDDSALVRIHRILQKGHELSAQDNGLATKLQGLQQAKTLIEETLYELRDYSKKLNADPTNLEELESKLSQLRKLQKKYGVTVKDIFLALANIESEISGLENSEEKIIQLQAQISEINFKIKKYSQELHKMRAGGSATLAKSVNAELEDLNMKGLIFSVSIQELTEANASGISAVEFMIQSSKKDAPRALGKFASGGELSRILLSLKRVVGVSALPRTYLFDEVDAGVSGVTAEKVGRKLKSIAKGQQVICVTHLPQVAAFAHIHHVIAKSATSGGGVRMTVTELNQEEKIREIARMLSGEKITKSSLENARELVSLT